MSKQDQVKASIEGRFRLLTHIYENPEKYAADRNMVEILATQGSLCNLDTIITIDSVSITIKPISLNTLKKWLSLKGPSENFEHLNKLRCQALERIKSPIAEPAEPELKPNKRTRTGLVLKVSDLEATIAKLHAVNMVLIQALEVNRRDLLTISRTTRNGDRQQHIEKAINRIIKILSLNPSPYDDVALLTLKPSLQLVPQ